MDSRSIFLLAALFLSVAPLFFSVIARRSIKLARQLEIESLEYFFAGRIGRSEQEPSSPVEDPAAEDTIDDPFVAVVNSLEFLKFKYELPQTVLAKKGEAALLKQKYPRTSGEIEPHAWLVSGLLLALLLLALLATAAVAANGLVCKHLPPNATCVEAFFNKHHSVSLTLLASIAGAYTYMVRAFHQAVHNFDLEPSSFFGAASNLVFAIAVTQIATFYLAKSADGSATATGLLMIVAFIGAYMPDDILRYFLSLSPIKQLKQERADFGSEVRSIPIEVIEGVDSKVRFRLSDFHIEDVQHLASANPLMLFVETPYGFYQTLDWVAQAQLCVSVGPDALFKFWKLGIRTIFDLERTALTTGFVDDDLLQAIARIILPDLSGNATYKPDTITANVRTRISGSDTRRLRQIVNAVNRQLGKGAVALA